ncbi:MAG: sporulation transcription factor Spo0A [Christensenellaceae bacterium]|nr:sporulation transcription factor Spo0A [Christensenellaceae bacterium]MDD6926850.1 sporulation transcription factor Spo0A [bacterium]MDY2850861.1 sporulation transcription factor Spo0A [Christensenellaceae bacterium]
MKLSISIISSDFQAQSVHFNNDDGFELIAATDSGEKGLEFLKLRTPDVVLCDLIMKDVDGLTFIERCKEVYPSVKIVVYSSFDSDEIIRCAEKKGTALYVVRSVSIDVVARKIRELFTSNVNSSEIEKEKRENAAELRISNIFLSAGIPPHIRGYNFLREGVMLAVRQPEVLCNITKELYPSVAEKYGTSPSKVERAIRHAIEVAWARGRIENLNSIFGVNFYVRGDKPTNGELIALIADRIIQEIHMGKI